MTRLAVFDVDGTILKKGESRLKEIDLLVINDVYKMGFDICFASGRGFYELLNITENLEFCPIFIASDGAYCTYNNEEILKNNIRGNDVFCIFNIIKGLNGVCAEFVSEYFSYIYGNEKFYSNMRFERENQIKRLSYVNEISCRVYKITLFFECGGVYSKNIVKNSLPKTCKIVYESNEILEIVCANSDKQIAIENLKRHIGSKCEIAAFGDGVNDINMLKNANYAMAPDSAGDYIKSICNTTYKNMSEILKKLKERFC